MIKISNVSDVVAWRLCNGCGACYYICPEKNIELESIYDQGIRPSVKDACKECSTCLQVCSGINNIQCNSSEAAIKELIEYIGPALEVWEGYSNDDHIRFNGSSGGIATALSIYALESGLTDGVLHIRADEEKPWLNKTVYSKSVEKLKRGLGSRYAPASPCEKLSEIESNSGRSVFVGKPCDVSSLRNAQKLKPVLAEKTALIIGIFCAGTPSTKGTVDLLSKHNVTTSEIDSLRYRGNGWPGTFCGSSHSETKIEVPYIEAWAFIQKYRPLRCYFCADGTSETADISCGDAWYLKDKDKKGISLIVVRNEKGKKVLQGAIEKGYITAYPSKVVNVILSQESLFSRQKEQWGRFVSYKLFGIPVPVYTGWPLLKNWFSIGAKAQLRSILSSLKRIFSRRLYLPKKKMKV